MNKIKENLKNMSRATKIIILSIIAVLLVAVILVIIFLPSGGIAINIETSLEEIITSSQLRTAQYTYNSITDVMDGDKVKYHVAYEGVVTAGCDFEQVQILREGTTIQIIVPDIEILEVLVDPELDYIFAAARYDTERTYAEATEACKADLRIKAEQNETLMKTARESAKDTIMALVKPFESQLAEGETFEIVFKAEKEAENQ